MKYPLSLAFRILSWGPQISVHDADGSLALYVKQKALKLKEAVTVFADEAQTEPLYRIAADRVIDFAARYSFRDARDEALGSIKRQGMKSIWKARYDIFDDGQVTMTIAEENPWVKVLDATFSSIPLVGIFSGYLLHPAYVVSDVDGAPVMRLVKQPAFFEGKFTIEKLADMKEADETRALLGLLMMILLERGRG